MTYGDFFRALTPYNYGEIKSNKEYIEKFKSRVDKVLKLADADGDGFISFTEFFFFVTIL
jgi:Ca2+-binding EF-hand superfamily protein